MFQRADADIERAAGAPLPFLESSQTFPRKRQAYLEDLAKRTTAAWKQVESLIAERNAQSYDRAVTLLTDLRDASVLTGKEAAFQKRLQDTVAFHARKSTLIRRIEIAGL